MIVTKTEKRNGEKTHRMYSTLFSQNHPLARLEDAGVATAPAVVDDNGPGEGITPPASSSFSRQYCDRQRYQIRQQRHLVRRYGDVKVMALGSGFVASGARGHVQHMCRDESGELGDTVFSLIDFGPPASFDDIVVLHLPPFLVGPLAGIGVHHCCCHHQRDRVGRGRPEPRVETQRGGRGMQR
jgi:hypothetical protein